MKILQSMIPKKEKVNKIDHTTWELRQKLIDFIQMEWSHYPARVKIHFYDSFDEIYHFPRTSEKNELIIGVVPWERENVDVIVFTKYKLSGEYILNTKFENLTGDRLSEMGLLPVKEKTVCIKCKQFSTQINVDQKCYHCSN